MNESIEQHNMETEEDVIALDVLLADMWKGFKRFRILFLLIVCMSAGLVTVVSHLFYKPEYQAEASFTISTENVLGENSYSYDYNYSTAGQLENTFPYLLDSEVMQEILLEELDTDEIPGEISADAVTDTNLFTLRVTSETAEDAYNVLVAVMNNYSRVARYVIGDTQLNILMQPTMPTEIYNPFSIPKMVLIGAMVGILISVVIDLVYALRRKTIRRSDDIRDVLNQDNLGTLPRVYLKKRKKNQIRILISSSGIGSNYPEAIRSLRAKILKKLDDPSKNVIMVTSTANEEGKTTTVVNLALSLCAADKKVILIDADLRHPQIEKMLRIPKIEGSLQDVLSGKRQPLDALVKVPETELYILSGTQETRGSLERIGNREMENLLNELRPAVDYILIDTPSCGVTTDAASLARYTDYVLYVVAQDDVAGPRILDGIQNLAYSRSQVLGCIFNKAESGVNGYGYGYYGYGYGKGYGRYGYGYGYGYGKKNSYGYGKNGYSYRQKGESSSSSKRSSRAQRHLTNEGAENKQEKGQEETKTTE